MLVGPETRLSGHSEVGTHFMVRNLVVYDFLKHSGPKFSVLSVLKHT